MQHARPAAAWQWHTASLARSAALAEPLPKLPDILGDPSGEGEVARAFADARRSAVARRAVGAAFPALFLYLQECATLTAVMMLLVQNPSAAVALIDAPVSHAALCGAWIALWHALCFSVTIDVMLSLPPHSAHLSMATCRPSIAGRPRLRYGDGDDPLQKLPATLAEAVER